VHVSSPHPHVFFFPFPFQLFFLWCSSYHTHTSLSSLAWLVAWWWFFFRVIHSNGISFQMIRYSLCTSEKLVLLCSTM
jgi:hypothetical protein